MKKSCYPANWFPSEIIRQAIWLYLRFALSFRDVEDLLAERGIVASYESVPALGKPFWADDRRGLAQTEAQAPRDLASG